MSHNGRANIVEDIGGEQGLDSPEGELWTESSETIFVNQRKDSDIFKLFTEYHIAQESGVLTEPAVTSALNQQEHDILFAIPLIFEIIY
jgi:hypothetical protein